MKRILSLLLAFVFLQTETWAIGGGPLSAGSTDSVSGLYVGVLIPRTVNRIFQNPSFIPTTASDSNSLGLFAVSVPTKGVATGNYLFFQDGEAFFGTITGVADPGSRTFRGLIAGSAATNQLANGVEFLSPISAVGKVDAKIVPSNTFSTSFSGSRLKGSAFIQLQGFIPDTSPNGFGLGTLREIQFVVDGFKQSAESGSATIPTPSTVQIPTTTTTP